MTNWPTFRFNEVEMEKLTAAASNRTLEMSVFIGLYLGRISEQLAIHWAEAGDVFASDVLLKLYEDKVKHSEEISDTLQAFASKTFRDGRLTRGRGHRSLDDWKRNIGITFLVAFACNQFGINPTRNREQKNPQPSASWVVSEALRRHGFKRMSERRVEDIWLEWNDRVVTWQDEAVYRK